MKKILLFISILLYNFSVFPLMHEYSNTYNDEKYVLNYVIGESCYTPSKFKFEVVRNNQDQNYQIIIWDIGNNSQTVKDFFKLEGLVLLKETEIKTPYPHEELVYHYDGREMSMILAKNAINEFVANGYNSHAILESEQIQNHSLTTISASHNTSTIATIHE